MLTSHLIVFKAQEIVYMSMLISPPGQVTTRLGRGWGWLQASVLTSAGFFGVSSCLEHVRQFKLAFKECYSMLGAFQHAVIVFSYHNHCCLPLSRSLFFFLRKLHFKICDPLMEDTCRLRVLSNPLTDLVTVFLLLNTVLY